MLSMETAWARGPVTSIWLYMPNLHKEMDKWMGRKEIMVIHICI